MLRSNIANNLLHCILYLWGLVNQSLLETDFMKLFMKLFTVVNVTMLMVMMYLCYQVRVQSRLMR